MFVTAKRRSFYSAITIILMLFILVGCSATGQAEARYASPSKKGQRVTNVKSSKLKAKPIGTVFHSESGKFTFNIPLKWNNDYKVVERISQFHQIDAWMTYFMFAPKDNPHVAATPLLTIARMSKQEYNSKFKKDYPGIQLQTDAKYIWIGILPPFDKNPYPVNSAEGKLYYHMQIDQQVLQSYFSGGTS